MLLSFGKIHPYEKVCDAFRLEEWEFDEAASFALLLGALRFLDSEFEICVTEPAASLFEVPLTVRVLASALSLIVFFEVASVDSFLIADLNLESEFWAPLAIVYSKSISLSLSSA